MPEGSTISKQHKRNICCFIIGCLASVNLVASERVPTVSFAIKPSICVLADGEQRCEDLLNLQWQSALPQSVCLFRSDEEQPLKCWMEQTEGEHSIEISASKNIEFQLKAVNEQKPLASESFKVVQDNVKYRRRRNPWSFF